MRSGIGRVRALLWALSAVAILSVLNHSKSLPPPPLQLGDAVHSRAAAKAHAAPVELDVEEEEVTRMYPGRTYHGMAAGAIPVEVEASEQVCFEMQQCVRMGVEQGFGITMLAYGPPKSGDIYINQIVGVVRIIREYYPAVPFEVFVSAEHVALRTQQLAQGGVGENTRVIPLDLSLFPHLKGHSLKPLVLYSTSFQVPLFLDTDVLPCPISLGVLLEEQLRSNYDVVGSSAMSGFHASLSDPALPLRGELRGDALEEFKNTPELNSGAILFNKSSEVGMGVLMQWIKEVSKWSDYVDQYPGRLLPHSDQGALRIALFRSRADLSVGLQGRYRLQCPVFLRADKMRCSAENCLFKHGPSYKYGSTKSEHEKWVQESLQFQEKIEAADLLWENSLQETPESDSTTVEDAKPKPPTPLSPFDIDEALFNVEDQDEYSAEFGVAMLVYGTPNRQNGDIYMDQAIRVLTTLRAYYPTVPVEIHVTESVLQLRTQQVQEADLDNVDLVPLDMDVFPHLDGHNLKPLVVWASRFAMPLFLDTDVLPCEHSVRELLSRQAERQFDIIGTVAQSEYHATSGFASLPLQLDGAEGSRFKRTYELNSGVILFNKRSQLAMDVLRWWVIEAWRWKAQYVPTFNNMKRKVLWEHSDQGSLRIALFRAGPGLNIGFGRGGLQLQCTVFLKADTIGCRERCLFIHGDSYKFGSPLQPKQDARGRTSVPTGRSLIDLRDTA